MFRLIHNVRRRPDALVVLVLAVVLMGAPPSFADDDDDLDIDKRATYEASVQRTEGGIPHIRAHDFASLGFGTGYAMAEDILCLLADDRFLTFSAERSRFLGEGGGNLNSDFFYQLFIDRGEAEDPVDPRQAAVFRGAAAGYNRYLRDTPVADRDATCGGEPFVREIGEIDWRRVSRLDFFLPFVSGLITSAQPPAPLAATKKSTTPQTLTPEQHREIQVAWNAMIAGIGMPRMNRQLRALLRVLDNLVDASEVKLGVNALAVQVHRHRDDVHVAGALSIAEQSALDTLGAGHHGKFSCGDCATAVVVCVH